ncbi:MAG: caspase family protein [Oscillatoria princeps RMCB-10]|jgi:uncharacterized caspase-like protein|nr:caspase family protein [Oscillatoria princeps RMCB-10]
MSRDALVVGINSYPFMSALNKPARDAEEIARILETRGDFLVRRLPETRQGAALRVNPEPNPQEVTQKVLEEAIVQLFNPGGDSIPETALLFFAGHGVRKTRGVTDGFLAASDTNPKKEAWGVSLKWLRELLQESQVRQQIVWLDCCYAG